VGQPPEKMNREGQPYGFCLSCRRTKRNNNPHTYLLQLLSHARRRSRKKNLEYNLNLDFAKALLKKQQGVCSVSGQPLTLLADGKKGQKLSNLSLDRIDNSRGYTRDNVRFVCWVVNIMRHNQRDDQLLSWCYKIIEHNERKC
jgi:hypothetical protein